MSILTAFDTKDFAQVVVKENRPKTSNETTLFGTVSNYNGTLYVKMDGSDQLTPMTPTTSVKEGDRVTVLIKNHSATITGNVSNPSAGSDEVNDLGDKVDNVSDQIAEFEIIIADKVSTEELEAEKARIDELIAKDVVIEGNLDAANAEIDNLKVNKADIEDLNVAKAEIEELKANKIDAEVVESTYATIENLEATNADIHNLEADYGSFKDLATDKFTANEAAIGKLEVDKLDAAEAEIKYANIDFANIGMAAVEQLFAKSGIIGDLVVGDSSITGTLVGVTIKGDLIEGGTVVADKLVILGDDGLYYKLNTNGETVSSEQTEYNSLSGTIITAKSITAEKINVNDLVAFGATIGGYHITASSLYSGAKASVSNTTRGVYMGDDGQFAVGDSSNYLKYFKDTDGSYKLAISAKSIVLSSSNTNIEDALNVEVGGRNYVKNRKGYESNTSHGLTVDYLDNEFHIYGTATKTDANFGFGVWINLKNFYEIGELYTVSTVPPLPEGLYLGNNTANENNQQIGTDGYLYGPNKSKTFTIPEKSNGLCYGFFGVQVSKLPSDKTFDTTFKIKLEKGNKATDWVPATEDMATAEDAQNAQDAANTASGLIETTIPRVDAAESELKILSNSISTLVTDANGSSLMTQTSDGWTFNIGAIQSTLNDATSKIQSIEGDVSEAQDALGKAESLIDDLSEKTAYIVMTTDSSGAPCIELGKEDNDFKVRITNTSVDFMEGSSRIAYISNQSLYIETAVIKDELKIGDGAGFVWKRRSNGNLGLRWVAS